MTVLPALATLSMLTLPAFSAEYFVSPTGLAAGNGSRPSPWNLSTALAHPAAVRPGDTIWVLGGIYKGQFVNSLRGVAGSPITVRAFPGERPILESDAVAATSCVLEVNGAFTWFWGLELRSTRVERRGERAGGLNIYGPGMKFINNIIHDTGGIGVWNGSDNTELYGNLIFDNGYEGPDRGHGHSIYSQNLNGTKRLVDNVYFDSFSHGIHIYGSANAWIDNYHIEGNIGFNNGIVSATGITTNILLGGGKLANNSVILNNATFFTPGASGNGRAAILGYGVGCNNTTVRGNTFSGSPTAMILSCTNVTMDGNTFLGAVSGFSQWTYPSNTYLTSQSNGGTKVYVRPNQYEPGRAHVAVYNWAGLGSVGLNLTGILNFGDSFEVIDTQDYFGAPVYSGVYAGPAVNVTTLNTSVYRSFGNIPVPPVHTPSIFNAFLVRRTSGTTAPANRAPVVSAGSSQTITLPGNVVLNGVVLDAGYPAGTQSTFWSKGSGPGTVTFANASAAQTTATFSAAGSYVLSLTVNNGTLTGSASVAITVNPAPVVPTPTPTPTPVPTPAGVVSQTLRINAGGAAYVSAFGAYVVDQYFTGVSTFSSPGPIGYTVDTAVYGTQRHGNFTDSVPVRNGLWSVQLKFAELAFQAAGKRVFDVYVKGVKVSGAYDILVRAGGARIALNQGFSVGVTTGLIEIRFVSLIDQAAVSGIELVPVVLN